MATPKHLLLDVSVIVDLWCGTNAAIETEQLIDEAVATSVQIWVAASSLATLDYVGRQALKRQGYPHEDVKDLVAALLNNLLSFVSVLSCHGFEQQAIYNKAHDFEDAQIAAAARSLPGADICLVTEDATFDHLGEIPAVAPARALQWLRDNRLKAESAFPFTDLAAQQCALRPWIEQNMENVLRHGQYIMGPEVRELEVSLAGYVGVKHCISCSSGTDALLMALMALDIGPGDEVITAPYTWISTAEVIALLRATPVFVDIQEDTFNIDPDLIESAITSKTRAIMPVGIYGQCPDMDRINAIAGRHGIPVIEDAAQSFGATYKDRQSCALSTIGCTSFFPSKPLGGYGDGGAVFTSDDGLADTLRQIKVHGQKVKHQHPLVGINGRLDTLQAAILLPKLEAFPRELIRRQAVAQRYSELLTPHSLLLTPHLPQWGTSAWAQYTILSNDRDRLSQHLKTAGIPSVAYYTSPLHLQGAFQDLGYQSGDFPVTEQVAARCLSLPMSPYLSEAEQEKIASTLKAAVE